MPLDPPAPATVPDLTRPDATCLRLVNLLRSGDGFVVQAVGTFPGSAPAGAPTRVDIALVPPVTRSGGEARQAQRELVELARRLQDWCDAGTPLRLVGASGSALTLVAEDGTMVPLPRSA